MAAHCYWRLVGFAVNGSGSLELSEARLYAAGVLADEAATLTCTIAPASGTLADLRDGLASSVVSWLRASSGFALVWDFGVPVAVDGLRLGSGGSPGGFLADCTLQWSDYGLYWVTESSVQSIAYPGAYQLTDDPANFGVGQTVLQLQFNDPDGSTVFVDSSRARNPLTTVGSARHSTAQRLFFGASGYFDGAGHITTPASPRFLLASSDFYYRGWVYPTNAGGGDSIYGNKYQTLIGQQTFGIGTNSSFVVALMDMKPLGLVFQNTGGVGYIPSASQIPVNAWSFIEYGRAGNTCYLWVNGVLKGTAGISGAADPSTRDMAIFSDSSGACRFQGFSGGIQLSVGAAVSTSGYTPPSEPFAYEPPIPVFPTARRGRLAASIECYAGVDRPLAGVVSHLREHVFLDVYHGGRGIIRSTVKRKNTPIDTPLRRRVELIDERSRLTIRSTWSDAVTGNYEFRGVREDLVYCTVSYDHLHNYRATIADNLTVENGGVELLP